MYVVQSRLLFIPSILIRLILAKNLLAIETVENLIFKWNIFSDYLKYVFNLFTSLLIYRLGKKIKYYPFQLCLSQE